MLFCILVALGGCVTVDAKTAYDFSGSAEKGLFVVSAGHTNALATSHTPLLLSA